MSEKKFKLKLPRRKLRLHTLRPISYVTAQEEHEQKVRGILGTIIEEANQLEDEDIRDLWLDAVQTFANDGDAKKLIAIATWRRKVVDMEEFMFGKTYLGLDEEQTFPAVYDVCMDLDGDQFVEAVLTGALGWGKSTVANIMLARAIYKISCMRHPQTTFGVQSNSSIVFTIQSVRFNTAKKAVFEEFGRYIEHSPYFRTIYPYDRKVQSQMIFREQNISILPVTSSITGVISMNVIGGILDEVNFMQKIEKSKSAHAEMDGNFDQAQKLYNTLARRRRSRFTRKGKLPGLMFIVSSSRYPDDFTETKAAESFMEGGADNTVYVARHSQWSAKDRDTFMDEEFNVQVGNERIRSKVLAEGEKAHPACETISVPKDFFNEFVKDVDGSLRDYAGKTTLASRPFIGKRDSIYECMLAGEKAGYHHPFNMEEIDLSLGLPKPDKSKLLLDIKQWRACHVDLGLKKDACGISVGHIAGTKIIERRNPDTDTPEMEILPVIGIDFCLRIVPPPGGEIEFAAVRKFITSLRDDYGLDIRYITLDGFQSVDSRQILRTSDFQADYHSVDKTVEPYRTFRDALYDSRILLPKYTFVAKELAELELLVEANKDKVDHRPKGSKDVADSLCGVVSFLLKRRAAWAGIEYSGRTGTQLIKTGSVTAEEEGIEPTTGKSVEDVKRARLRKASKRKKTVRRNLSRMPQAA